MKPLAFTQFVSKVLNVRLSDGQRVLCLVAYDGLEPRDLDGADRELARLIFGDVEVIPREARPVLVAVCGARGGKTYILGALRLLHLALTVPLTSLAPGELASGLIVAPDLRLARQCLRYAHGAASATASIKRCIVSESADNFVLKREHGQTVTIEALPATRGGSALRGRSLVGAVLDEAAFFRDDNYTVNDAEIFKAVSPRVLPEGQTIVASTPWAEGMGLLYDMFSANHGAPKTAIAAHAPTLLLRTGDERIRHMVERERDRDHDNAAREFDAQFMTSGTGLFFDPSAIDAAVDDQLVLPTSPAPFAVCAAGADFGFRSDASAIAIAALEDGLYRLLNLVELRPSRGAPLVPSEVVGRFASEAAAGRCAEVIADRHYEESIREHLVAHKLRLVPAPDGMSGKVETYTRVRALLLERKVRLPREPRLLAQLKSIVSVPTSGGGLTIRAPRRGGAHGDLVSAFVLAIASLPSSDANTMLSTVLVDGEPLTLHREVAA